MKHIHRRSGVGRAGISVATLLTKPVVLFCLLAVIMIPTLYADEHAEGAEEQVDGPGLRLFFDQKYFYWLGIVPSGLAGTLEINKLRIFEGSTARLYISLGAGLESATHYRGLNGQPYYHPAVYNPRLSYNRKYFELSYSAFFTNDFPVLSNFYLSPFVYFRGNSRYQIRDTPDPVWDDSEEWQFRHEILGGLVLSNIRKTQDIFALRRGFSAEISLGYAANSAPRISLGSKFYGEIAATDVVVLEFKGRLLGDYLFPGARFDDLSFFGGRGLNGGLGGVVRGYEYGSYSAPFKAAVNAQLHLVFAPFTEVALNPGIMLFVDGGIYAGEQGVPDGGLLSAGVGVTLDAFNIVSLMARVNFPIVGSRLNDKFLTVSAGFSAF